MDEKQAIDLLWEEWKYRHSLFWQSLFRWAGAVVALWVIPFVKPEVFRPWPRIALLFPMVAFVLSLFSAWILGAEQRRFTAVAQKYNELRKDFVPPRIPANTTWDSLFAAPLGAKVAVVYGISFGLISGGVFVLLWTSK